jgi:hypothetical protein
MAKQLYIDPRQLKRPDEGSKQYIFKCRISGAEYSTLALNENKAFFNGPHKMGWTREPDPDADPKNPNVLHHKYYAPGYGKGPQLTYVKKLPGS